MVEIVKIPIHKLKVVHVVLLGELILQIKQRVSWQHVILVWVIQPRMKIRIRTSHRDVSGTATQTVCTTTQNPPPQNPVPPPDPVSVYLHQNVQKSMEMNQTVQAVSVVLKDVLLLVRIVSNLPIYAHHVLQQPVLVQME